MTAGFSVVLPAAGAGSRLGLPYPKEIHEVVPGHRLIDFSLDHIRSAGSAVEAVTTVICPGKEAVTEHARTRLGGTPPVHLAWFDDRYVEWPGSIRSAAARFGDRTAVMLPDSVLEMPPGGSLFGAYSSAFDAGADLVFAAVAENDPKVLTRLGALAVDGSRVVDFCDKPDPDEAGRFNAFWASFSFRAEVAVPVLELMAASVARQPVDLFELGLSVAVVPVARYTDLGTWPSIEAFQARWRTAA